MKNITKFKSTEAGNQSKIEIFQQVLLCQKHLAITQKAMRLNPFFSLDLFGVKWRVAAAGDVYLRVPLSLFIMKSQPNAHTNATLSKDKRRKFHS
jgi:hypothetical protein